MKLCCPKCKGKGEIELFPAMQKALSALAKIGRPATREEIHTASRNKGGITATYRLIARLGQRGLVKQVGKQRPARFRVG